jgi:hypothetical protein
LEIKTKDLQKLSSWTPPKDGHRYIGAVASGLKTDGQGERMTPQAIDYFREQARTSDLKIVPEHKQGPFNDMAIVVHEELLPNGDWYLGARMYDESDLKSPGVTQINVDYANKGWAQLNGEPPYSKNNRFGLSVEGLADTREDTMSDDILIEKFVLKGGVISFVPIPAYGASVVEAFKEAIKEADVKRKEDPRQLKFKDLFSERVQATDRSRQFYDRQLALDEQLAETRLKIAADPTYKREQKGQLFADMLDAYGKAISELYASDGYDVILAEMVEDQPENLKPVLLSDKSKQENIEKKEINMPEQIKTQLLALLEQMAALLQQGEEQTPPEVQEMEAKETLPIPEVPSVNPAPDLPGLGTTVNVTSGAKAEDPEKQPGDKRGEDEQTGFDPNKVPTASTSNKAMEEFTAAIQNGFHALNNSVNSLIASQKQMVESQKALINDHKKVSTVVNDVLDAQGFVDQAIGKPAAKSMEKPSETDTLIRILGEKALAGLSAGNGQPQNPMRVSDLQNIGLGGRRGTF